MSALQTSQVQLSERLHFVHNFSTEVGSNYIDLEGAKSKLLTTKQQFLAGVIAQKKGNEEILEKLVVEENCLTNKYNEALTFSQMETEINGDAVNPGAISILEKELQQQVNPKSGLGSSILQDLNLSICNCLTELISKQSELMTASQQVSFKHLYEAVLQVQPSNLEICPACKTPLIHVTTNPYIHASRELEKLQHLTELQGLVVKLNQNLNSSLITISQALGTCCSYFPESILHNYCLAQHAQVSSEWWNSLHQVLNDGYSPWQHLEVQVKQLEEMDEAIDQIVQQRSVKEKKLEGFRWFNQEIIKLKAQRNIANTAIAKSNLEIGKFNTENAQLISDAEAEKSDVLKNISIANSYAEFVKRLNAYKNSLPAKLVADLGVTVVALYNAFNRNDSSDEYLAEVRLPLAQNHRLEISFENAPTTFFDALHILSEGHIRCLGLAILMAKNLKENCPLLIFDDPVNAIDDDHKEAIRITLFKDDFFSEKQIILACHGEEFFKDIQNRLPREIVSQAKLFSFLPRLGHQHVRIDFHCPPRNYIIAARDRLDRGEIRDALAKSRQALEYIAKEKLWKYVNDYGDGNLSIKMRNATSPIELRGLADQLRKKIVRADFLDSNKTIVLTPLEVLLGMDGNSREWRYLNKGTHEESNRAEFERSSVIKIVNMIEALDSAL
ncbi:hypothetical protein [Maridesulfovibrio ferrireducens]|uniref:hypothetical protein n=1 Tax=Maridesulfovibrio ferrireducens TaxID=246191 RepID=UPI001A1CCCD5|nr:hypothetical protein [Maridesulfovibrio ferrireducens]MBI9113002.1 hypothetical protein [Maridesulfovibrio ferrireducens]